MARVAHSSGAKGLHPLQHRRDKGDDLLGLVDDLRCVLRGRCPGSPAWFLLSHPGLLYKGEWEQSAKRWSKAQSAGLSRKLSRSKGPAVLHRWHWLLDVIAASATVRDDLLELAHAVTALGLDELGQLVGSRLRHFVNEALHQWIHFGLDSSLDSKPGLLDFVGLLRLFLLFLLFLFLFLCFFLCSLVLLGLLFLMFLLLFIVR